MKMGKSRLGAQLGRSLQNSDVLAAVFKLNKHKDTDIKTHSHTQTIYSWCLALHLKLTTVFPIKAGPEQKAPGRT